MTTTDDAPPDPDELEPVVGDEVDARGRGGVTPTHGPDAAPPPGDDPGDATLLVDRRRWITLAIVGAATLFVVWNLRPWVWFTDTTPTGGDLGAHVWSPAYLRDVLLPDLRLTGWTPDWYAGFPAFTFYMVVPSLLIVLVNVGLDVSIGAYALIGAGLLGYAIGHRMGLSPWWRLAAAGAGWFVALGLGLLDGRQWTTSLPGIGDVTYSNTPAEVLLAVVVLPALAGLALWQLLPRAPWRAAVVALGVVLIVALVPVPYGVAIKLVVVAGMVTLPVAAWAAGRLGGLAYPGPAVLAVMTLPFIFDRSYNIYGGNLMSTMAGEFAYSIGLTLAVLYIGVAVRGMETGRHRGPAAVLLALTGLSHLFPAFFALVATAAMLIVRFGRRSIRWLMTVGSLAFLLSAFWVVPFMWNTSYLNDMGWGKERRFVEALWSRGGNFGDQTFLENDPVLQVFVVLALVGAVLSGLRRVRLGMVLSITAITFAAAFLLLPEGRLWNVRILPFYYLSIYLLAGVAVSEISRMLFGWRPSGAERSGVVAGWRTGSLAIAALVLVMVTLAVPLRALPFGSTDDAGEYGWSWAGGVLSTSELNLGPFWLSYNFRGYEDKAATEAGGGTAEYTDMVATMTRVGEEHGCGRALWEYESGRLGSYGTTMAPMLLPHWTDGCIGSMEGLYFEASATTPYHFLLQSELSSAPSRAQRDLPYSGLDVAAGVPHLQTLGVRYYMAFSEDAVAQARVQPELTEIATSGPWVVFSVADSDLVVGLDHLPVVMEGTEVAGLGRRIGAVACTWVPGWSCPDSVAGAEDWLLASVASWGAGDAAPLIAADGPADWPRVDSLDTFVAADPGPVAGGDDRVAEMRHAAERLPEWLGREEIEPVEVSDVRTDRQSISFTVAEPGSPVLVRTSSFPNWEVSGADGPYRVAPNLMVVVPTDTEVELTYGRSPIEWFSILLTLGGFVGLVVVGRRPPVGRFDPLWDLAADPVERPGREELIAAVRRGEVGAGDLEELGRTAAEERRSSLRGIAVATMLVGASLVAASVLGVSAEEPALALLVWLPSAAGVILLVFRALPRHVDAVGYQRRTLAPAAVVAELMAESVPPRPDDEVTGPLP